MLAGTEEPRHRARNVIKSTLAHAAEHHHTRSDVRASSTSAAAAAASRHPAAAPARHGGAAAGAHGGVPPHGRSHTVAGPASTAGAGVRPLGSGHAVGATASVASAAESVGEAREAASAAIPAPAARQQVPAVGKGAVVQREHSLGAAQRGAVQVGNDAVGWGEGEGEGEGEGDGDGDEVRLLVGEDGEEAPGEPQEEPAPLSHGKLLLLSLSGVPTDFGWAVAEALVVPNLLQMHVSESVASMVWFINPVVGLLMQPVVGMACDRCRSPLGKRRPFIIALTVVAVFGMLVVAYARELAKLASPDNWRTLAIVGTFVGFGFMDLAHDLLSVPTRALVNDIVPDSQRDRANSNFALMAGLGRCIGLLFASAPVERYAPFFMRRHIQTVFGLAALVCTLVCLIVCCGVHEKSTARPKLKRRHRRGALLSGWQSATASVASVTGSASSSAGAAVRGAGGGVGGVSVGVGGGGSGVTDGVRAGPRATARLARPVRSRHSSTSSSGLPLRGAAMVHYHGVSTEEDGGAGTGAGEAEADVTDSPHTPGATPASAAQLDAYLAYDSDGPAGGAVLPMPLPLLAGESGESGDGAAEGSLSPDPSSALLRSDSAPRPGMLRRVWRLLADSAAGVRAAPPAVLLVCAIQLAGWFIIMVQVFFWTTWVGTTVFGAKAESEEAEEAARFEEGVRWGTLGAAANAFSGMVFSAVITPLNAAAGRKRVYYVAEIVFCVCMLGTALPTFQTKWGCIGLVTVAGLVTPVHYNNPFVIIDDMVDESERAQYVSMLNLSMVIAQILVSVSTAIVTHFVSDISFIYFCASILVMLVCLILMGVDAKAGLVPSD